MAKRTIKQAKQVTAAKIVSIPRLFVTDETVGVIIDKDNVLIGL
jgi:hypothetical protein